MSHTTELMNFTQVEDPGILVEFISLLLMYIYINNKSKDITIFCSLGPVSIMPSIQGTNMIFCGRDK